MTLSLTVDGAEPGIFDRTRVIKWQDQFTPAFTDRTHLTRNSGTFLGAWARGEKCGKKSIMQLWTNARNRSHEGRQAILEFLKGLSDEDKTALKPIKPELIQNAKRADSARSEDII